MKHAMLSIAAAAFCAAAPESRAATVLVWDDFTEGDVHINSDNAAGVSSPITSPIIDTRIVGATGNPTWSVTMDGGTITWLRVLDPPGSTPGRATAGLLYTNSTEGTFSIFGPDSYFVLDIFRVVGSFILEVSSEITPANDRYILIDASGHLEVPVSRIASEPLEDIHKLRFEFTSQSPDFALSIREITLVVPEPSVPVLAASGALLVLLRRRRH